MSTDQLLSEDNSKRGVKRPRDSQDNDNNDSQASQPVKINENIASTIQNHTDIHSSTSNNVTTTEKVSTSEHSNQKQGEVNSDSEEIGPAPPPSENGQEQPVKKKVKTLKFAKVYLAELPSAEMYERSYMHRDVVTHIAVTRTDYIITASQDGHVKFWKKLPVGIEFVKHFRAHSGT